MYEKNSLFSHDRKWAMVSFVSNWLGGKAAWGQLWVVGNAKGLPNPLSSSNLHHSHAQVRWRSWVCPSRKTSRKAQADAEAFCDAARMDPSLLLPKIKSTAAPAGRSSRHAPLSYHQPPVASTGMGSSSSPKLSSGGCAPRPTLWHNLRQREGRKTLV